jgi:hypothetical protein
MVTIFMYYNKYNANLPWGSDNSMSAGNSLGEKNSNGRISRELIG